MPEALKVATPSDREIVVSRSFDAPRELVWKCLTTPELLRLWLLGPEGWTMSTCDIDLRVGGKYRYAWSHPERPGFGIGGEFREVVVPERMVDVQRMDGMPGSMTYTQVFTARDGKTEFVGTMLFDSKELRDAALKTGMTGGMEMGYVRLDKILAEPT